MAFRSHRRPLRKRRTALALTVAAAAVGLLVSLVIALRPGGEPETVRTAAGAATGTRPTAPRATHTTSPAPKPSKTCEASGAPKASRVPAPAATTRSARPSPAATRPSAPRPVSGKAPLAGRIKPGTTYDGVATHYDAKDGDGACLYGPSPDLMVAAMNHADYETSQACGAYIRVRAANGASVTVRITNECPLPCAPGQLDLSKEAFAKLAGLSAGRIPITWSLDQSPGTSQTLSIRCKTGSSSHWCGIQALGHRNPLARLEVRTGSGWTRLTRTEYNYFLSPGGTGCGGSLRLTDIYGEQLTVDGIAIRPDTVQPTRVQFTRR
ncbi:expansin EXLX1 family cellulose-binding protein [Streptomyces sp. NPDC046832]|uniref:expansin EXLX1 family cellulose-binding protein n=1 Tax=Streptomyces sp. NPDC046832 TaxID=3155020 RepID=UPI0033C7D72F